MQLKQSKSKYKNIITTKKETPPLYTCLILYEPPFSLAKK